VGEKIKGEHATSLQHWLTENYGEIDVMIGVGQYTLLAFVTRGKKYMKLVPKEWKGIPVKTQWTGKIRPC
jgi:hypothetical protein